MFSFRFIRFFSTKVNVEKFHKRKIPRKLNIYYSHVYGERWDTIRQALLAKNNYIALMNNFSDHSGIIGALECKGAIDLHQSLDFSNNDLKSSEQPSKQKVALSNGKRQITFEPETNLLIIPEQLKIYTILKGNIHDYPQPKYFEFTHTISHILLNGASILPAIALDVQPGERVLDACSAPGIKALVLAQMLLPFKLVCNEIDEQRRKRIENLFKYYTIKHDSSEICTITMSDASQLTDYESYDKILVDVPCSTDRHTVRQHKTANEQSRLFGSDLLDLQQRILVNCIRLLRPGGSLVYSTCSLNPEENDGVVDAAISKAMDDYNISVIIRDMSKAVQPYKKIFEFESPDKVKYGQLVVPTLTSNFGPLYFCKLVRRE